MECIFEYFPKAALNISESAICKLITCMKMCIHSANEIQKYECCYQNSI